MGTTGIIATRLADLGWNGAGVLVVRFKPEPPLDVEGITEIMRQRFTLSNGMKARVMSVLPAGMDFQFQVPTTDHHAVGTDAFTLAEAVVAPTPMLDNMARLYFKYFPQTYPTAVFATEDEAQDWLLGVPAA